MIVLEELKPILEPLLEGREDSTDIIAQVQALDKPGEADQAQIDSLNAEWQSKMDTALADAAKEKDEAIKRIFFGAEKAEQLDSGIPEVPEVAPIPEDMAGDLDNKEEVTGENITIDDLFSEKIVE